MSRTCGDCIHLDARVIPTQARRPLQRCLKLMTLEFPDTPRGDQDSIYACRHFTTESDVSA